MKVWLEKIKNCASMMAREERVVVVPHFPLQKLDRELLAIGGKITYNEKGSWLKRFGRWLEDNT